MSQWEDDASEFVDEIVEEAIHEAREKRSRDALLRAETARAEQAEQAEGHAHSVLATIRLDRDEAKARVRELEQELRATTKGSDYVRRALAREET